MSQIFSFSQPENNARVWRYMDFTKLVSMMENNGLFFARADCLSDPFEGYYGGLNMMQMKGDWLLEPTVITELPQNINLPNEEVKAQLEEQLKQEPFVIPRHISEERREEMKEKALLVEKLRKQMMISCWCLSEYESAALWKLYSKSDECVAITNTFVRLQECLPTPLLMAKIVYVNLGLHYMPYDSLYYPFIHKRISFEHEHELRIMFRQTPNESDYDTEAPNPGVWKQPLDMEKLLPAIFVSPTAAPWFMELVEQVVKRYNLTSTIVRQSKLNTVY